MSNGGTTDERLRYHLDSNQLSRERLCANWIWIIARTCGETRDRIGVTWCWGTGRTGAVSLASVLPARSPVTDCKPWYTLDGTNSFSTAHRMPGETSSSIFSTFERVILSPGSTPACTGAAIKAGMSAANTHTIGRAEPCGMKKSI